MAYKSITDREWEVISPLESPAGWTILPIHYSHDTTKGEDWVAAQRALYDRDSIWMREMEHDFTAQLGNAAYPAFSEKLHVKKKLKLSKDIPISLCCDFNVDPCIFEICQIRHGYLLVIDEICLSPASIPEMVVEFRNRYPDHIAGINIYGDSNGLTRSVQTQKSEYDLMKLHFRGYPGQIIMRVSRVPPKPKDRINALNNRLKSVDEKPMVYISKECVELISDLREVVLNKSMCLHGQA